MVKTRNLPDDPGEGRTMTGAEGELTVPPSAQATGPQETQQAGGEAGAPAPGETAESGRERARLVFASFLMLFVELALIRWVAANNVYVTKATNFVLLASFLGIGIGFLNARSQREAERGPAGREPVIDLMHADPRRPLSI
jgi:positive regulator of sigma E activity